VSHQAQETDIIIALLLLHSQCSCTLPRSSTHYFKRDKEVVPH